MEATDNLGHSVGFKKQKSLQIPRSIAEKHCEFCMLELAHALHLQLAHVQTQKQLWRQ